MGQVEMCSVLCENLLRVQIIWTIRVVLNNLTDGGGSSVVLMHPGYKQNFPESMWVTMEEYVLLDVITDFYFREIVSAID
jgi:hypothetical protein